jgi:hypothetical protein
MVNRSLFDEIKSDRIEASAIFWIDLKGFGQLLVSRENDNSSC